MKRINIFSDEISNCNDQLFYKNDFLLKFGDKIDSDDPFYFDGINIIDEFSSTIHGAKLNEDSWNHITKVLIKYFHLD